MITSNKSILQTSPAEFNKPPILVVNKGWHCRHDASFLCEIPSDVCLKYKVNIDHALKLQDAIEDSWRRWNNGDRDTRNWND